MMIVNIEQFGLSQDYIIASIYKTQAQLQHDLIGLSDSNNEILLEYYYSSVGENMDTAGSNEIPQSNESTVLQCEKHITFPDSILRLVVHWFLCRN